MSAVHDMAAQLADLLEDTDQAHAWEEIGGRFLHRDPLIQVAWHRIVEDVAVAAAIVTPHERASERHIGWLRMAVAPEFRGEGYGGQALEAVLEAARRAGLRRIEAAPWYGNRGATRFFERHGFQFEGIRGNGYRTADGQLVDQYVYAYLL